MPYTKVHQAGQEKPWCVYRLNADGTQGEQMGCSATEELANGMLAALHMREERNVVRFAASGVEGEIEGYLALWGDPRNRDSYTTYFDQSSPPDLGLKDGQFLPLRLMYEHGYDQRVGREIIGAITSVWSDNVGIAFRATLDKASAFFARIVSEIQQGSLKTSSASADHLAEFTPDKRFGDWYLSEVSLTADPAEDRMPAVALVRSASGGAKLVISTEPEAQEGQPGGGGHVAAVSQVEHGNAAVLNKSESKRSKRSMLTLEQLGVQPGASIDEVFKALSDAIGPDAAKAFMASMVSGGAQPPTDPAAADAPPEMMSADSARGKKPAPVVPKADNGEIATLRAELEELKKARLIEPPAPEAPVVRTPQSRISVGEPRRYWGVDMPAMMLTHQVLRSRGRQVSQEFIQVLAGRAEAAIEKKDSLFTSPVVRSALKATRADEIVTSTNTSNGDEWIGVAYSGQIWEKARNARIYQQLIAKGMRIEEVPQGSESTVIFTEGSDPTAYTIAQSADLDATGRPTVIVPITPPTTGNVTATPGYVGLAVAYTSVFDEDSMIRAAPQLQKQLDQKAEETIEHLMLNGDTAASGNVNYDGGTPSTSADYKATNGFRKYALVTGSSTSRDAGALDENDYRLTLALFPSAIRSRKDQIAFIHDADTHNTALALAALKTQDVRGSIATLESGVLSRIWGVDVFESGFLPLTDSDGKVTYNAAGTKGTILGVYAPYWVMAWKRHVTVETDKDILAQTNLIVVTFRMGMTARGAGAAVASYDITIA